MRKPPSLFKVNEITRKVTVEKKKKGARKPETVTIEVTVRLTHRSSLDRNEVRKLIERAFGSNELVQEKHESKRPIDKK